MQYNFHVSRRHLTAWAEKIQRMMTENLLFFTNLIHAHSAGNDRVYCVVL